MSPEQEARLAALAAAAGRALGEVWDSEQPPPRPPRSNEMSETATAKIFKHGLSQAVRLPKEFRLPGKDVRVRGMGRGVLLEPVERDRATKDAIFAKIDREGGADFLPQGRPEQPPMPPPRKIFDE